MTTDTEWRSFRPSNGTEGAIFMEGWCERCKRDKAFQDSQGAEKGCPIVAATMAYNVGEPGYPKEWVMRYITADDGLQTYESKCTAFEPLDEPERCKHTADMFKEATNG